MAIKELNTRIALKYDSYSNWTNETVTGKGGNLVLLPGELGICEISIANTDTNVAPTVLFKVGGAKYPEGHEKAGQLMAFKDLPWTSAKAADVYSWAKASDVVLDGKVIKFVGTDKTITLDYLTQTEVNNLISPLATDIAANDAAIKQEAIDRAAAISEINEKIGGSYSKEATIHTAIEAAKQEGTEAKQQITTLTTTGQVATNRTDIATIKTDIAQLESDIDDEIAARKAADKDLSDRLDSIDAFFTAADHDGEDGDGLTDALDTLKEIQDYLNGEGSTAGSVVNRIAANEEAIAALQDLVEDGGDLEVRVDTTESGVANLEAIVAGYSATSTIKTAIDAAKAQADKGVADAGAAKAAADAAQSDVDDLAALVGNDNSGLIQLVNTIKNTANTAATDIAALTTRVGTAENNITTLQGIVSTGDDSNANLRSAITELQSIVNTGADANATLRSDLTALQGVIYHSDTGLAKTKEIADGAASQAAENASDIAAIAADYLKAADDYILSCGSSITVLHANAE